ncbi:MAG: ABC transporter ATP-binding protein [Vulcanimicrobiaceae bacterium]
MPILEVAELAKSFPAARGRHAALQSISFSVSPRRTLAVVGPSGAGKSTLLRIIAGLEAADSGTVRLGGRALDRLTPQARRIAMVFQDDALIAHGTLRANLRFALRARNNAPQRVADAAQALHLSELLDRRVDRLSGGERQRAAIARALLSDPDVLLLDEPLAHLDPPLRVHVRSELLRVRGGFAGPVIYVTHDHVEAMAIADDLGVLIDGRLEALGNPQTLYDAPSSVRIARFLGSPAMNLLDRMPQGYGFGDVIIGIRPEYVRVVKTGGLPGRVTARQSAGADAFVHIETPAGTLLARVTSGEAIALRGSVGVEFAPERIVRYDRITGGLLA